MIAIFFLDSNFLHALFHQRKRKSREIQSTDGKEIKQIKEQEKRKENIL